MTDRYDEMRLEIQAMEELCEVASRNLMPADGVDGSHVDTLRGWIAQKRSLLTVSTLEHLFAEGQLVPELDEADFAALCEIVQESAEARGWTVDVHVPPSGEREVLVHLNVRVPASDSRNAGEVGAAIEGALEVGFDDESVRGLRVAVAMCEDIGAVSEPAEIGVRDEQEKAYDLASADHAVPMPTGVVMLLADMVSHDHDMITLLVPDASEEVVAVARRILKAELEAQS